MTSKQEYYQKNKEKLLEQHKKRYMRKCRKCGKNCWGKVCLGCFIWRVEARKRRLK